MGSAGGGWQPGHGERLLVVPGTGKANALELKFWEGDLYDLWEREGSGESKRPDK